MDVTVKGRNISVTEALERYAFEKVERVAKFFDDGRSVSRAEVELIHERNPSIPDPEVAEATLFINGSVLKAREASQDMYASIDRMSDKLERQVRRYRGRQIDRWHGQIKGSHAEQPMHEANRRQLVEAGVAPERVHALPLCTMCRTDLFFSYRQDRKLYGRTGRLMSVIGARA